MHLFSGETFLPSTSGLHSRAGSEAVVQGPAFGAGAFRAFSVTVAATTSLLVTNTKRET